MKNIQKSKSTPNTYYNSYYSLNKRLGKILYLMPLEIEIIYLVIMLCIYFLRGVLYPSFIFIAIMALVCVFASFSIKQIVDGEILEERTPIKIKITDDALYFTSISGKIKEIKLENIELVTINKTLFGNGSITKIMERIDEQHIKNHYLYLEIDLAEKIQKTHSKYVNYKFNKENVKYARGDEKSWTKISAIENKKTWLNFLIMGSSYLYLSIIFTYVYPSWPLLTSVLLIYFLLTISNYFTTKPTIELNKFLNFLAFLILSYIVCLTIFIKVAAIST